MTTNAELVERLLDGSYKGQEEMRCDAADAITSLEAQLARARKALGRIERGATSVLLDATLNDDPIVPDVLEEIIKDASSGLTDEKG